MGGIIQPANEDLLNHLNSEFESMRDFRDDLNALVKGLPNIPCGGLHSKLEEPVLDLQTRPIDNQCYFPENSNSTGAHVDAELDLDLSLKDAVHTNTPGLVEVTTPLSLGGEFGHVRISEQDLGGVHLNRNSENNIGGIHAVDDLGLANYTQEATQICSAGNVCVEFLNKEDEIGGPVFAGSHVGSNNVVLSSSHSVPVAEGAASLIIKEAGDTQSMHSLNQLSAESRLCEVPVLLSEELDALWVNGSVLPCDAVRGGNLKGRRGRPRKYSSQSQVSKSVKVIQSLINKQPSNIANSVWKMGLDLGVSGCHDEDVIIDRLVSMEKRDPSAIGRVANAAE
ncbi:Solute carrier family 35 member F1 [Sesbania bispinosa]|nr:Solute carrier family 35 member F1 [Sesbania bispinosa]